MENAPIKERADLPVADDITTEAYSKMPVESFGMSLMKQMGFSEERGIGKNKQNALPQILVLKPRPKGLGLGATPTGSEQEQVEYEKFYKPGTRVKVVKGAHRDLIGVILKSEKDNDVLLVQLELSEQNVKLMKGEVECYNEQQEEPQPTMEKKKKRLKWVIPGITVKIIDKASKHYLQKVRVLQITGEREFECITDSKQLIKNLTEKSIQTVIPAQDELVIVLRGPHRGARAKLKERWRSDHTVMVQTLQELEFLKLAEDEVCAYED